MILARLSHAIRTQNWFAMVLEFVIVIAGVVIGFQVTGWNAERSERVREAAYLERLHAEVEELESMRGWRVASRQRHAANLVEVADFLHDRHDITPGEGHCTAIGMSFTVSNPTDRLGVLDELLSVGGFDTIRSPDVREAIARYMLATRRAADANTGSEIQIVILHDRFPELFEVETVRIRTDADLLRPQFECDFDAMRANTEFRHAFATNAFSFTSHNRQNEFVSDALRHLHDAVDQTLGLTAEDHDTGQEDAA